MKSKTLKTTLQYLSPLPLYKTTKPYHINIPSTALEPGLQSNEVSQPYYNIPVEDLRGRECEFSLNQNGFGVFSDERSGDSDRERPSTCLEYKEYDDNEKVKTVYRRAVGSWLKEVLGADEVLPFTHEVFETLRIA